MAKTFKVEPAGNRQEQETFDEVSSHYDISKEDLDVRILDFDKKDILFRSHIDETKWPYRAQVFDPRIFTALFEKTARMFANKPTGRLIPREGGDSLGARINNELLSWQWDDNERAEGTGMLAKWALMDLNCRKYGASFAYVPWTWKRQLKVKQDNGKTTGKSVPFYDGPDFRTWNNRDVLVNPSYSAIKNWCQLRGYPTLQELESTNDAARGKAIYKNLDILKDKIKEESQKGGDARDVNYISKNKTLKGLTDYLGRDEVFKTIEMITEYREDRWITFAPRYGVVVRDKTNPYEHSQIPIVMLKYYIVDDDIYGLSEIEPVEKIQRAINALISQYLDAINQSTYNIAKVSSVGGAVQLHTLQFGPGAKWMMQNPQTDVLPYEQNPAGIQEFTSTYRFMIGAMQEALGETSAAVSNLVPGGSNKTATEVKDLAISRSARDNFNQLFLAEAMKKQMGFWHTMNQQFLFANPADQQKVLRIVGKDAIAYFQKNGLDGEGLTDENIDMLADPTLAGSVTPQDLQTPLYPVNTSAGIVPKMRMEADGQFASMLLEKEDLAGNYDYIPDMQSMQLPDETQMVTAAKQMMEIALNPVTTQLLMADSFRLKAKEVLSDYFERLGLKDADKYFEKIEQNMIGGVNGQINQGGTGGVPPSPFGGIMAQGAGMGQGSQAVPAGQGAPVIS